MTRHLLFLPFFLFFSQVQAQNASIKGQLQDQANEAVVFANVALYSSADSNLVKVESSDDTGVFQLQEIRPGDYFLVASYVGLADLVRAPLSLSESDQVDLGVLRFAPAAAELEEVTVTANRAMVEVKPDRTVFNVQGTINSAGDDALALLRKAPGVTVTSNNAINVLGRTGVLLYVDGKRLPLTGDDLSSFLQNLPAEQIDRIDIISNPGARYEAEGNAGIIDIILKRDKNLGTNGSVSTTLSQGRLGRAGVNLSGNHRNKRFNLFGQAGLNDGAQFDEMDFSSTQNGLLLIESNDSERRWEGYNLRLGADFFLGDKNTIGLLLDSRDGSARNESLNRIVIAPESTGVVDSILRADNSSDDQRLRRTANLNYRFDNRKGRTLNVDLDYGRYENSSQRDQPNRYFDATEKRLLSSNIASFDTRTDIDIYTFKLDFEQDIWGGKLGAGTKLSRVESDNFFLVYDENGSEAVLDPGQSNEFYYDESVYAGYLSFARPLSEQWNLSLGLRAEQTDATGDLIAYDPDKQEPRVELNYLSWFPNAGLTWNWSPQHAAILSYGRRINRPDYNVLNPFRNRLSEISFEKGNPTLNPEIVNNVELGYTFNYRYNFKLGYSLTENQITRLIGPADDDVRSNFITWDNLATQTVISFNASAPVQVNKVWNAYFNLTASYLDNQAVYEEGGGGDVLAFTYVIFQQHTFTLGKGFRGEISGYYSGPGVWGGVFEYESNWSLNVGLQRKFLRDRLNVRLSVNDIFYQTGWDGVSEFDGLISSGRGRNDSRRAALSLSYSFGNENVKSRRRKTGIEEEAGRVSDN